MAGLVAALLVADRITAAVLEDMIASRVGCDAEVDVGGFPVLTQLSAGSLDEVTVEVSSHRVHLRLSLLEVGEHSVGRLGVVATVPWRVINERTAVHVEPAGSRVALVPAGGAVTVLATVGVAGGAIRVEPDAVEVLGQEVPLDALAGVADLPDTITLRLPALPAGTRATAVAVTAEGLAVHAEGSGIELAGAYGAGDNTCDRTGR